MSFLQTEHENAYLISVDVRYKPKSSLKSKCLERMLTGLTQGFLLKSAVTLTCGISNPRMFYNDLCKFQQVRLMIPGLAFCFNGE